VLDYKLMPWRGYWVRAYRNVTLRLDPIAGRYGRAAGGATGRAVLRGSQGWAANLRVETNDLRDTDNRFGVASGAADGFDGFKVEKPPAFGDRFIRLTFDHPDWGDQAGGYGVDIRSASNAPKTWSFTVASNAEPGMALLTWPDLSSAGRRTVLTLTDLATGVSRDMRSSSGYTWQTAGVAERKFTITMTAADRSALRISDARATQAGRSGATEIAFVTSAASSITVRVLNQSGGVVRTLPTLVGRAAGAQQVRWDQRDARGVMMPAGAYQVEIRARASDGGQAVRAVTQLIVTR
jgi:hypothetical protein